MTSNRPKHIEPSSTDSTSGDTIKARALEAPEPEQLIRRAGHAVPTELNS